jgi:hypothetical protein
VTIGEHFNAVAIALKFNVPASALVDDLNSVHFDLGVITATITEPERLIALLIRTRKSGFACIVLLSGVFFCANDVKIRQNPRIALLAFVHDFFP